DDAAGVRRGQNHRSGGGNAGQRGGACGLMHSPGRAEATQPYLTFGKKSQRPAGVIEQTPERKRTIAPAIWSTRGFDLGAQRVLVVEPGRRFLPAESRYVGVLRPG